MLILVKLVVVITRQWGKDNIFKFLAFFRSHLLVPLQWLLLFSLAKHVGVRGPTTLAGDAPVGDAPVDIPPQLL